jgi:hypothetical protein
MTISDFDPRNLTLYKEPRELLHFQWQDDTKVYRYALVEVISEKDINHRTKQKKNARYTQVRDSLFRSHPWNCLQKRVALAADTATPAWGFSYQFTLPADCLRLLKNIRL